MIIGVSGQAGSGKDTVADFLVENHGFVKIALADEIKRTAKRWWGFTDEQLWGPSEMRNRPDHRYPENCRDCAGSGVGVADDLVCGSCKGTGGSFLTPRKALQLIGTEVGRLIDGDVWVRYAMRIANELLHNFEKPDNYGGVVFASYDKTRGIVYQQQFPGPGRVAPKGVVISDCRFKNEFEAIKKDGDLLVRINRPKAGLKGAAGAHASEAESREVEDDYFDLIINNVGTLSDLKNTTAGIINPVDYSI